MNSTENELEEQEDVTLSKAELRELEDDERFKQDALNSLELETELYFHTGDRSFVERVQERNKMAGNGIDDIEDDKLDADATLLLVNLLSEDMDVVQDATDSYSLAASRMGKLNRNDFERMRKETRSLEDAKDAVWQQSRDWAKAEDEAYVVSGRAEHAAEQYAKGAAVRKADKENKAKRTKNAVREYKESVARMKTNPRKRKKVEGRGVYETLTAEGYKEHQMMEYMDELEEAIELEKYLQRHEPFHYMRKEEFPGEFPPKHYTLFERAAYRISRNRKLIATTYWRQQYVDDLEKSARKTEARRVWRTKQEQRVIDADKERQEEARFVENDAIMHAKERARNVARSVRHGMDKAAGRFPNMGLAFPSEAAGVPVPPSEFKRTRNATKPVHKLRASRPASPVSRPASPVSRPATPTKLRKTPAKRKRGDHGPDMFERPPLHKRGRVSPHERSTWAIDHMTEWAKQQPIEEQAEREKLAASLAFPRAEADAIIEASEQQNARDEEELLEVAEMLVMAEEDDSSRYATAVPAKRRAVYEDYDNQKWVATTSMTDMEMGDQTDH